MTAQQAIERANQMKAGNAVPDERKLVWLTEIDGNIYKDVILNHMHDLSSRWWSLDENNKWVFAPAPVYTEDNTTDELIAPSPYDVLYEYWLMAQIDLFSNEYNKYNNDIVLFENEYQRFKNWYHRNHRSVPTPPVRVGNLDGVL